MKVGNQVNSDKEEIMFKISVVINQREFNITFSENINSDEDFNVIVNGDPVNVIIPKGNLPNNSSDWVIIENRPYEYMVDSDFRTITVRNRIFTLGIRELATSLSPPHFSDGKIKAPIPGKIRYIMVKEGAEVVFGQPLLVLEAMKMENEILAPCAGIIKSVNVNINQNVTSNELLLVID